MYTGMDTSGHGTYNAGKVISVANGILNKHLHTENGTHYVSAALPKIPGHSGAYDGLTYGRYAVRFRVDQPTNLAGYKTAWLLWPDSNDWQEGEIDFPEGNLTGKISAFMHHRGNPQAQEEYHTSTTYANWHTAVIEWTPQSVRFMLDDTVIGNDTNTPFLPNTSMHLGAANRDHPVRTEQHRRRKRPDRLGSDLVPHLTRRTLPCTKTDGDCLPLLA